VRLILSQIENEHYPFVTIILLCYNYEKYLNKALEMIAVQTFSDFEVVFVNNGSTDKSGQVAADFFKTHNQIRHKIITIEKNNFSIPALKAGIENADGKYVMFHDGDDYMDPDTLELLVANAKENDADRVFAAIRVVDEDGKLIRNNNLSKKTIPLRNQILQASLYRRSILVENKIINMVEDHFGYDMMLNFLFSKYIKNFACVLRPCYNYVYKKQSITGGINFYKEIDNPRYSYIVWVNFLRRMYEQEKNSETREWLEYMAIQCLWDHLGRTCRCAPSGPKCSEVYRKYKMQLSEAFPNYRKNRKLRFFAAPESTAHNRLLMHSFSMLERTHTLWIVLRLWNFISRRKYIAMV